MNKDEKLKKLTPEQEMIKNSPLFLEIYKGQEEKIDHLTKICPFPAIGANNEAANEILDQYHYTKVCPFPAIGANNEAANDVLETIDDDKVIH